MSMRDQIINASVNKIKLLLVLFAFSSLICPLAKAQTYTIESFEGAKAKISLSETFRGRALAVICLQDTIFLNGYRRITKVRVLKGKFLQITYNVGGGTGLSVDNTAIFCVINQKMHVSVVIDSYSTWFSPDPNNLQLTDIKDTFSLHFKITGDNIRNYKLIGTTHVAHRSKINPDSNYRQNKQFTLGFDSVLNIFYSERRKINQSFVFNDPITCQTHQQEVNETIPVIGTWRRDYYYIRGEWYKTGYYNTLFKDYYR